MISRAEFGFSAASGVFIVAVLLAIFSPTPDQQAATAITRARTASIETVTHDGHHYILSSEGGILHAPDCPCHTPQK